MTHNLSELGFEHEEVRYVHEPSIGLKAIIAIHDTTLGPAGGGTRRWIYKSELDALKDALELSKAMTLKYAIAGCDCGGGKGIIIVKDPNERSEALYRAYARYVDSYNGRFFTGMDVGTGEAELRWMAKETEYIFGLPETKKGVPPDWSPTAYGVLMGMKACLEEVFGDSSLEERKVAVQGLGKVGYPLVKYLIEEGAEVVVTDINDSVARKCQKEFGVAVAKPSEKIYDVECDIFSPCALGGILNDETIPRLKCKIIAGGANNQLAHEGVLKLLEQKNILYAPDFLINVGQAVDDQETAEKGGYNFERSKKKIAEVFTRTKEVINIAKREGITTHEAALKWAKNRIESIRKIRRPNEFRVRKPIF